MDRLVITAFVAMLLGAGCKRSEGGCDLAAQKWKQTSPGACAESTWSFAKRSDGAWDAKENGCANASGVARYDGAAIVVDFEYEGGNAKGRYTWPVDASCKASAGTVSWSAGSLKGKSAASTLAPMR